MSDITLVMKKTMIFLILDLFLFELSHKNTHTHTDTHTQTHTAHTETDKYSIVAFYQKATITTLNRPDVKKIMFCRHCFSENNAGGHLFFF